MEKFEQILGEINDFVWGIPLLILLVGTGIYLTFRLGFLQIKTLPYALSRSTWIIWNCYNRNETIP